MAIQVNGTEVISNSRALNNIASVDATTVAALSSAGVGGSGFASLTYKNANYTMQSDEGILVDCTSASRTITLPASPSVGDRVVVMDPGTTWAENSLTVTAGSGKTIKKVGADAAQSIVYELPSKLEFVYIKANEWSVIESTLDSGSVIELFVPDSWLVPSETITSSRNYTLPSEYDSDELVWILINSAGGAGNQTMYQSSWSFAGTGGSAGLFLTSAGQLSGASMTVAGSTTPNNWNANNTYSGSTIALADGTQVTSGDSSNTSGTKQVHHVFQFDLNTNLAAASDQYISITRPTQTNTNTNISNISGVSAARMWGGSQDGPGETRVFGGGDGYKNSQPTQTGYATRDDSVFSGNGGAQASPGVTPGGGGGGRDSGSGTNNTGARGEIRLYFYSDNS